MKPTEAGEEISAADYLIDIVCGYEQIARDIRHRAGEAFARNRDTQAKIYRDLAIALDEEAKLKRQKYEEIMRPKRDEAFEFLEELEESA